MTIQNVSARMPRAEAYTQKANPRADSFGPAYRVTISPEARQAYTRSSADPAYGPQECETCKNRKYQDGSDDPSVTFQSPTRISPGQAAGVIAAHEGEHVSREQMKADQENRKIISQTVRLKTGICPECGRVYIAGGSTRTVTAAVQDAPRGLIDFYA
jgi:hypothetical protein